MKMISLAWIRILLVPFIILILVRPTLSSFNGISGSEGMNLRDTIKTAGYISRQM